MWPGKIKYCFLGAVQVIDQKKNKSVCWKCQVSCEAFEDIKIEVFSRVQYLKSCL